MPALILAPFRYGAGIAVLIATILAGCAGDRRASAPPVSADTARVPQIAGARYWGDVPPPNLVEQINTIAAQRRASGITRTTSLVMSGGADYGAYGAGVLNAMTERGTRPDFTVVTGVSTGALSAPFVFLGPRYDRVLQAMYGYYPADQIARPRRLLSLPQAASVADSAPLANLIDAYVTDAFLAEIAREHSRGRRLFVMSTNIDAQRPVIWDLGAIAASGAPNARQVFRDAVMASAALPIAFDPVLVSVEADGATYQEMHVDGGLVGQITLAEGWQDAIHAFGAGRGRDNDIDTIYVVINNRIGPEPEEIRPRILSIAKRTTSTMVKYQIRNDLKRAEDIARLRGARFRATWIGDGFPDPYVGPFDLEHMQRLFAYGYRKTMEGRAWTSELRF